VRRFVREAIVTIAAFGLALAVAPFFVVFVWAENDARAERRRSFMHRGERR